MKKITKAVFGHIRQTHMTIGLTSAKRTSVCAAIGLCCATEFFVAEIK